MKVYFPYMDFNDPKEFDDASVSDDPKRISTGSMDFDNPKDCGDGLVFNEIGKTALTSGNVYVFI